MPSGCHREESQDV